MARMTKAQREWRPGMKKKRRSTRVLFASTVLTLEAGVALFATLAVFGLYRDEINPALIFLVGGWIMAVCILACAFLSKPLGYWIGWTVQVILILLGFVDPSMFVVGVLFALCWWYAVTKGRTIDRENARRDALQAEWDAAHPEPDPGH
ncbi:DUF4233 domain-containing protein [Arthrobacter sp. JSM 101049]|uniref:DUF4233 domain-containing protein n=1 Tax=Arthrobacter sp. JSM 101049 TaxID=929097 RepID=UPI0035616236